MRWAGSKRSLLPHLLRRVARGGRYYEPFAGSACLFFSMEPADAVLGDRNDALIGFYRTLRRRPYDVAAAARVWPADATSFYAVRALDPHRLDAVTRAARFLYLNRLCFNGVYRTNRQGEFNVPYGRRLAAMPSEAELVKAAQALRRCALRSADFEETIADARMNDFVYLDPPYTQSPQTAHGVYGYGSFHVGEIDRMIAALERLDRRGVRFLFSYADVEDVVRTFPPRWSVERLQTAGQVAGLASARQRRREILVTNPC